MEKNKINTENKNSFLIQMQQENEPLVTIKSDATVVIHKYGNDKKAAKKFWESLQIEGKTLIQTIEDLKKEIKLLKGEKQNEW